MQAPLQPGRRHFQTKPISQADLDEIEQKLTRN